MARAISEWQLDRTRIRTRVSQIEGDKLTTSETGPVRVAGSNPGCANREVENFSDELEPGSNPGRANRRFFRPTQKFANGPAVDRTGDLQDETAAVQPLSRHDVVSRCAV